MWCNFEALHSDATYDTHTYMGCVHGGGVVVVAVCVCVLWRGGGHCALNRYVQGISGKTFRECGIKAHHKQQPVMGGPPIGSSLQGTPAVADGKCRGIAGCGTDLAADDLDGTDAGEHLGVGQPLQYLGLGKALRRHTTTSIVRRVRQVDPTGPPQMIFRRSLSISDMMQISVITSAAVSQSDILTPECRCILRNQAMERLESCDTFCCNVVGSE